MGIHFNKGDVKIIIIIINHQKPRMQVEDVV